MNYGSVMGMKTDLVLSRYKTPTAVALALGISLQAVCKWGVIVPHYSATELHRLSDRQIPLEPEHYGPGGRILPQTSPA
jgi:hypothetical protein